MDGGRDVVLSTAYFPPVDYFSKILYARTVYVEQWENFQKQTFRSRCRILSADGPAYLVVPVERSGHNHKTPIRETKVDYSVPWVLKHERALDAAYNSSAFFPYYREGLFSVLDSKPEYLFDLNMKIMEKLLNLGRIRCDIKLTSEYLPEYPGNVLDCRRWISPKNSRWIEQCTKKEKPYFQVFSSNSPFISCLSFIDLLSSEGCDSGETLEP
ncbi:MAG: WbqC family protein [Bacteroidales bacterium]|jgi:hypothetical protein|nr:WbqC family protein [Bacteroidales bacterium]MCI2121350.1 WbqC family protein [Bacteroidales bacterium]MCI2145249.1 WbqC family protein [Bacteroidales bacterium]